VLRTQSEITRLEDHAETFQSDNTSLLPELRRMTTIVLNDVDAQQKPLASMQHANHQSGCRDNARYAAP
jgi:hypothetical protein